MLGTREVARHLGDNLALKDQTYPALACGAMATAQVAPLIAREHGIQTFDPVVACGLFARYALRAFRLQ